MRITASAVLLLVVFLVSCEGIGSSVSIAEISESITDGTKRTGFNKKIDGLFMRFFIRPVVSSVVSSEAALESLGASSLSASPMNAGTLQSAFDPKISAACRRDNPDDPQCLDNFSEGVFDNCSQLLSKYGNVTYDALPVWFRSDVQDAEGSMAEFAFVYSLLFFCMANRDFLEDINVAEVKQGAERMVLKNNHFAMLRSDKQSDLVANWLYNEEVEHLRASLSQTLYPCFSIGSYANDCALPTDQSDDQQIPEEKIFHKFYKDDWEDQSILQLLVKYERNHPMGGKNAQHEQIIAHLDAHFDVASKQITITGKVVGNASYIDGDNEGVDSLQVHSESSIYIEQDSTGTAVQHSCDSDIVAGSRNADNSNFYFTCFDVFDEISGGSFSKEQTQVGFDASGKRSNGEVFFINLPATQLATLEPPLEGLHDAYFLETEESRGLLFDGHPSWGGLAQGILLPLNDSGVHFAIKDGNVQDNCPTVSGQDCATGRDAEQALGRLEKIGNGDAGFDFTKIGKKGNALEKQDVSWNAQGNEVAGNSWNCVFDNNTGLTWVAADETYADPFGMNVYSWSNNRQGVDQLEGENNLALSQPVSSSIAKQHRGWDDRITQIGQSVDDWGLCGYSDWRVPDVNELMSIMHYGSATRLDDGFFPYVPFDDNLLKNKLWTASPAQPGNGEQNAIVFRLENGTLEKESVWEKHYVWLVRGGRLLPIHTKLSAAVQLVNAQEYIADQFNDWIESRYSLRGEEVLDTHTGLVWSRCEVGKSGANCGIGASQLIPWPESFARATSTSIAARSGWRIPNVKELASIHAFDRVNPVVNASVFPAISENLPLLTSTYLVDEVYGALLPSPSLYTGEVYRLRPTSMMKGVALFVRDQNTLE